MASDLSFAWTRVRLADGSTVVPLAEPLDLPHGCRVSPAPSSYLVAAGAEVSYDMATAPLVMSRGSEVSAAAVMHALRRAGELCAKEAEDVRTSTRSTSTGPCPPASRTPAWAGRSWTAPGTPGSGRPRR